MLFSDDGQARIIHLCLAINFLMGVPYRHVRLKSPIGMYKNKFFDKLTVKPNKAVKVQLPGLNTLNPVSLKIFK